MLLRLTTALVAGAVVSLIVVMVVVTQCAQAQWVRRLPLRSGQRGCRLPLLYSF